MIQLDPIRTAENDIPRVQQALLLKAGGFDRSLKDAFPNLTAEIYSRREWVAERGFFVVTEVVDHDSATHLYTQMHFDKTGRPLYAFNNGTRIEPKGSGLGRKVFQEQATACASVGFKIISLFAGRSERENGYYSWARFGFNAHVRVPRYTRPVALTILMQTEHGRRLWRQHGYTCRMSFLLKVDSPSWRTLYSYLAEKGY